MVDEKYIKLSNLMFKDVNKTIEDLEKLYPEREINGGVTRFAPSPTGFLHTGALFTTLVNRMIAKNNGVFYLRIEDTDTKREVKGSTRLFIDELNKFKFSPDEGVISENDEKGKYGPYIQSKRKDIYRICAKYLVSIGRAYPCFCSKEMLDSLRESQEKNKIMPGYYGIYAKCRNYSVDEMIEKVENGEEYIVRFRSNGSHLRKISFVDEARGKIEMADNDQDIVIIKKDGLPTYHFAHACDDHFMRTTHVVRGEEWLPSTPIHLQLFEALGFKAPKYVHVPLIMVKDGDSKRKLSKRKDKEAAVSYFLKNGFPVEGVIEYLMTILNSNYESWRQNNKDKSYMEFDFKLNKLSSSGSLLDLPKLYDLCKNYIGSLSSEELFNNLINWSKEYNEEIYNLLNKDVNYSRKILALERDNVKKIRKDLVNYNEFLDYYFYFFNDLFVNDIKLNGYNLDISDKIDKKLIKNVLNKYLSIYDVNDEKDIWFNKIKEVANEFSFCTDMKLYKANKDAYIGSTADVATIIRVAVTNRKNTPDIYEIFKIIGEDEVKNRIKNAIDNI